MHSFERDIDCAVAKFLSITETFKMFDYFYKSTIVMGPSTLIIETLHF
jgi:hypothetical protein